MLRRRLSLIQWQARIHDWDLALAALPAATSAPHAEIHAWLVNGRAA